MPSRTLHCQPTETWLAWQIDDAVQFFGDTLEDRRWRYDQKTGVKLEDRLMRLLGSTQPRKTPALVNSDATLAAFDAFLGGR